MWAVNKKHVLLSTPSLKGTGCAHRSWQHSLEGSLKPLLRAVHAVPQAPQSVIPSTILEQSWTLFYAWESQGFGRLCGKKLGIPLIPKPVCSSMATAMLTPLKRHARTQDRKRKIQPFIAGVHRYFPNWKGINTSSQQEKKLKSMWVSHWQLGNQASSCYLNFPSHM